MSNLTPKPAQAIASRILRWFELSRDRFQLDTDSREALQQRVVNLAAHPRALRKHQRVLIAHRANPEPPGGSEHQHEAKDKEHRKLSRPVERRRHRELPPRSLGPFAIRRRAHPEAVVA